MTQFNDLSLPQAAVEYALCGVPVFPIHYPIGDDTCSCKHGNRCENVGKHPATRNGLHDATTDPETIAAVWKRHPNFNIGIATGHEFDVLDIDDAQAVIELEKLFGHPVADDPGTVYVETGRGWHVYYQPQPDGSNRAGIIAGVDWRAKGGYVIAPPSRHANGRRYRFGYLGYTQPTTPPAPLLTLLEPPKPKPRPAMPATATGAGYNPQGLFDAVSDAIEGTRNDRLHWAACRVADDFADGRITDLGAVLQQLADRARGVGLGDIEISKTIKSAMERQQ